MAGVCRDFPGSIIANCLLPDCIAARCWGVPTGCPLELSDDAKLGDCSSTSSGARLEVASAMWGTEDAPVDVTEILAGMVEADELTIPKKLKFCNVFGDPSKGERKQLVVVLKVDGETRDPLVLHERRKKTYNIIA